MVYYRYLNRGLGNPLLQGDAGGQSLFLSYLILL